MEEIITKSTEHTLKWAKNYANKLKDAVICLNGDMGAGKTVIVRGIAQGLGIDTPVTSPTFTLINEYPGEIPLYHFDLYRLHSEDELFNLGLEEYLEKPGIKIFEWASRFDIFPENRHELEINILDYNCRKIILRRTNK